MILGTFGLSFGLISTLPLGAILFCGFIFLVAMWATADVLLARRRCATLVQANWHDAGSPDGIETWYRSVTAMVSAGTAPTDTDEHEYFYGLVGYRFDRARTVASTLMVLGLLGTFVGMAIALGQSSEAMVALQLDFGNPIETTAQTTGNVRGDLETLRVQLESEMDSAMGALSDYVAGQKRAVRGMAIGVSTSIAGITGALVLFLVVGFTRRRFDDVLDRARAARIAWIEDFEGGTSLLNESVGELPSVMGQQITQAFAGVGDVLRESLKPALGPLVIAVKRFESHVAQQSAELKTWADKQAEATEASHAAFVAIGENTRRSTELAEASAASFDRIATALQQNSAELKEFRDGFEDFNNNLVTLAENYRKAGEHFDSVVRALHTIEQRHDALGGGIGALNSAVVGVAQNLETHSVHVATAVDATIARVSAEYSEVWRQAAGAVKDLTAATSASSELIRQEVERSTREVAQRTATTSAEVVRQVGPTIAAEIVRQVESALLREPWYVRMFPFLKG